MKVIEVAMEIAYPPTLLELVRARHGFRPVRDVAMSSSVGGIGPLLRERIVEQAEQGIEVIGVSLLYSSTWIQSWFDWGQLHLEKREVISAVREFLTDTGIRFSLPLFTGESVEVKVWSVPYGKTVVYFLDSLPITDVVYPSEEDAPPKQDQPQRWADDMRFKQSWLVGRGALMLAKHLSFAPDIVVLSETPSIFAHHRLMKDDLQKDPFFEKTRYVFNDHTPLEYAHPVYSKETMAHIHMDASTYNPPPYGNPHGEVDVTRHIIAMAEGVFGVALKHGRVMRAMPSLKDYASKIESITNGVYVPYWQAPELTSVDQLSDETLLELKAARKTELLDFVWRHFGLWHTWKEQVRDKAVVLWTRRLTGYKRMDLLWALCREPATKKQFMDANLVLLIGGRIHQHDDQAQTMIYNLLDLIAVDKVLKERIVFLENFNVWMAPKLFQGADAAIMLADDGREASATGFMKAQVNGDLIIATDDGAIPESVTFLGKDRPGLAANGFEVPYVNGHPTAEGLLKALVQLKQVLQTPVSHAAMVRAALKATAQVSIERTVRETFPFYDRVLKHPLV